jgi:hypothetical protein
MRSEVVPVAGVDRQRLFALYELYYEGADRERFFADLDEKDFVIVLLDGDAIAGFSTQKVFDFDGVRILFSGDTIIDPRHWGTQELVRAWCRFAGRTKAAAPDVPLYWFLISKGHRTYLYLPLFFERFHPSCDDAPTEFERKLMQRVGTARYGDRFNTATGLIDEAAPLDRLRPEIDSAPARTRNRHVAHFLECNARYADGVELVCLTEISASNMRSFARREMERGFAEALPRRRNAADRWLDSLRADADAFREALDDPAAAQQRVLEEILAANRSCEYLQRFRERPIVTYDDLEPDILRVCNGESNVLTSDAVTMVEKTSGSASAAKFIPYTALLRRQFLRALAPWMVDLYTAYPELTEGRAFWSVSPLARARERTPGGLPVGFDDDRDYFGSDALDEILALPRGVTDPRTAAGDDSIVFASIWNPTYLIAHGDMRWRNLRVISCWTHAAASLALPRLRAMYPHAIIQPKGLLATEGVVSIPIGNQHSLAITSHFFEFIDDEGIHLAHELRGGHEYRVLLTTGGGLYRYDLGDLVRVNGFVGKTPSVEFVGRAGDVVDLCGEKLSEPFVRRALEQCGVDAAVAFLAPRDDHYALFIDGHANADALDAALRANPHYDYCRTIGQLGALDVVPIRGDKFLRAFAAKIGDVKPRALLRHYEP